MVERLLQYLIATFFFLKKGIMNYEIRLLKTAGYTDKEISNMSQHVRRNLALEIEMELERMESK